MTAKKRTLHLQPAADNEEPQVPQQSAENLHEPENEIDPAVYSFIRKYPGVSRVAIARYNEQIGKYQHVFTAPAEIVSEEWIQKKFRGGSYELRLLSERGAVIRRRTGIEIADPPEDEAAPAVSVTTAALVPSPAAGNDLLTLMREEATRNHALMIEMIRSMRTEGGGNGSLTETVQALVSLKKLEPPQQASQIEMATTAFMKGLELRDRMMGKPAGDGEGKNEVISFFKEVLDFAKPLLPKAAPAAAPVPGEGEDTQPVEIDIEPALNYLKGKCLAGRSVEMIAENIIDQMQGDAQFTQIVLGFVREPIENFLALDPEIGGPAMLPWFTALYESLHRQLIPPNTAAG